jgi:lysyl-tRNA synthetase class II
MIINGVTLPNPIWINVKTIQSENTVLRCRDNTVFVYHNPDNTLLEFTIEYVDKLDIEELYNAMITNLHATISMTLDSVSYTGRITSNPLEIVSMARGTVEDTDSQFEGYRITFNFEVDQ